MLALAALVVVAGVASVADVPSPRPNGWVTDQAHVLDAAAMTQLDTLAERLHADRGIELAIVTVDDVPGTPKQFATALFNHWGVGSVQTNNGVLVLLVMGKRRLEVETGGGIEAALTADWLARMQRDRMVPRFKAKDFAGGLLTGVQAIDEHLRTAAAESTSAAPPGSYRSDGAATAAMVATTGRDASTPAPTAELRRDGVSHAPRATASDRLVPEPDVASSPPPAKEPPRSHGVRDFFRLAPVAGFVALGASGLTVLAGIIVIARHRRRRRTCVSCRPRQRLRRLDAQAGHAHLDAGQRAEAAIGSADYKVLLCPGCQTARIFRRGRRRSGYATCPDCSYKTSSRRTKTLIEPAHDRCGQITLSETCCHCGRDQRESRLTPPRKRPLMSPAASESGSAWPASSSSSSESPWQAAALSAAADAQSSSLSGSSSSAPSGSSGFSGGSSSGGGAGSDW